MVRVIIVRDLLLSSAWPPCIPAVTEVACSKWWCPCSLFSVWI